MINQVIIRLNMFSILIPLHAEKSSPIQLYQPGFFSVSLSASILSTLVCFIRYSLSPSLTRRIILFLGFRST